MIVSPIIASIIQPTALSNTVAVSRVDLSRRPLRADSSVPAAAIGRLRIARISGGSGKNAIEINGGFSEGGTEEE